LKLAFTAERPPPPEIDAQELIMVADPPGGYF
jgi:hypothetical protein